ncbi:MAG: hypothetical protein RMM17_12565 [Acidobacteriota bacterium]|nr:hypothetical protein [Blastocatellia bacterium]MDW8413503.1 hypothetical protein [Acidobacteriota bacterium]
MRRENLSALRSSERGEGNTKFIIVLLVLALIGFVVYKIMPVYYLEQQLDHDVAELARVSAINGKDPKLVEKDVKKIIDSMTWEDPDAIEYKVDKKGENITITCKGQVPINLLFYKYIYKVNISRTANRGGY